tara:strand:- start:6 stop:383 length:378 start_codon:yes stop_codon:yes gene_type:complete
MKMGTRKWNTWRLDNTSSLWKDYSKSPEVLERKPHHYFGSNILVWRTSEDLLELLNFFTEYSNKHRQQYFGAQRFSLWKIHLPKDAPYDIDHYEPIVEDKELIGTWCTEEFTAWMKGEIDIKLTG